MEALSLEDLLDLTSNDDNGIPAKWNPQARGPKAPSLDSGGIFALFEW